MSFEDYSGVFIKDWDLRFESRTVTVQQYWHISLTAVVIVYIGKSVF